jgi:hypothetical protein
LFALLAGYIQHNDLAARQQLGVVVRCLREGDSRNHPVTPFHWEIEFPEVFAKVSQGFDAFIGNPPYAGHVLVSSSNHPRYTDYLRSAFAESGGKCDLVAFFFRRAFSLLGERGMR